MAPLLEVRDLQTHYVTFGGTRVVKAVEGLSFTLREGETLGIVGESGSGKTTLLSLLRGLYQPEPGLEIDVDGGEPIQPKDIQTWLDRLNEAVTLFPQEPEIFENTIAYNITLGLPFSEAEIIDVCDTAHFTEVVRNLPQGLGSDIREKGVNLSGGQKQRLALARGILAARDSSLALLDEPTSSIDPRTEAMIYDNLFTAFSDKAIISSIHRLHLLPRFDHIYILQQGRIVAGGSFDDLRANDPIFRELWRHQQEADRAAG